MYCKVTSSIRDYFWKATAMLRNNHSWSDTYHINSELKIALLCSIEFGIFDNNSACVVSMHYCGKSFVKPS